MKYILSVFAVTFIISCGSKPLTQFEDEPNIKALIQFFKTDSIKLTIDSTLDKKMYSIVVEYSPIIIEDTLENDRKFYSLDCVASQGANVAYRSFNQLNDKDSIFLQLLTKEYEYNYHYSISDIRSALKCMESVDLICNNPNKDIAEKINYIDTVYFGLNKKETYNFLDTYIFRNNTIIKCDFVGYIVASEGFALYYNILYKDNRKYSFQFTFLRNGDYKLDGVSSI